MAASYVRELLVKLGVDADTAEVQAFDDAIEGAGEALTNLVGVATAAAAAVGALVGALVYQGLETASTAASIEDQAAALGLSTDAYQELTYAAEKAGGSSEDVAKALAKINVAGEQAAAGTEAQVEAFAALGITAEEVAAASPEELLGLIADGLQSIEDPAARAAAATAILGDELAQKMLPVLSGGAEGLAAIAEEAQNLGIIMDGDALDAAAAFDDQIDQLTGLLESLRNEIGLAIIPVLSELVSGFMAWVEANREAIATGIQEWVATVGELLSEAAAALAAVNDAIGGAEGWKTLAEVVVGLAGAGGLVYVVAQFVALASSIWSAVEAGAAIAAGVTGLATGPLALLAAGIAVTIGQFAWMALVVQDLYTWITGGDSVIGRLIERFRESDSTLGSLARLVENVGALIAGAFELGSAALQPFVDGVAGLFDLWLSFASFMSGVWLTVIETAFAALQPFIDGLATAAGLVASLTGAELPSTTGTGTYASAASTTIPTASATTSSTSYAPSAPTTSSSAGAAPVSQSVTQGSITITGAGLDKDEVTALINDILDQQARATAASFAAGEV